MGPNMKAIELKANEASTPTNGRFNFRTPVAGGQLLAPVRTMYWQYCFTGRKEFEEKRWMVGFEGIQEGSPGVVHHIVLHGFDKPGCTRDSRSVSVWTGSVSVYEGYPSDVGMSLSRYKSYRMEMHYDNPDFRTDLRDNSGVRIWTTNKKPQHEVGVMELADPRLDLLGIPIESGRTSWTFTCSGEQTKKLLSHKITVFSSILHMHAKGDMMYTEVTDSKGKTKRVNTVEYFDFDHQDLTLLERYEVNPGDTLTTRCFFKNPANNKLKFGFGSDEEMCIDFLLYYPAVENKNAKWCASETSSANAFMNTKVIKSDDDHDARVFGVGAGSPDGDQCKGGAVTVTTAKISDKATTTAKSSAREPVVSVDDTCVTVLASAAAALSFVVTAMMN